MNNEAVSAESMTPKYGELVALIFRSLTAGNFCVMQKQPLREAAHAVIV